MKRKPVGWKGEKLRHREAAKKGRLNKRRNNYAMEATYNIAMHSIPRKNLVGITRVQDRIRGDVGRLDYLDSKGKKRRVEIGELHSVEKKALKTIRNREHPAFTILAPISGRINRKTYIIIDPVVAKEMKGSSKGKKKLQRSIAFHEFAHARELQERGGKAVTKNLLAEQKNYFRKYPEARSIDEMKKLIKENPERAISASEDYENMIGMEARANKYARRINKRIATEKVPGVIKFPTWAEAGGS